MKLVDFQVRNSSWFAKDINQPIILFYSSVFFLDGSPKKEKMKI